MSDQIRNVGMTWDDRCNITFYCNTEFRNRVVAAAKAEGRSVSNFMVRLVERALATDAPGPVQTVSNNHSLQTDGDLRRGGRQVDLEEAIAVTKRSGSKAAKHK